ncbi:zinc ribbon domain-containing protein [Natranaerobius trueperi]|uniref:zinc ribbon domain-containing protein n=1 Tax=Natranaerobius trueperi TaxID=759412 RepID=UPI00197B7DC6|nr:zinc ribbon domain-containing protein [Natranaerobius trueperi]
MHRSILNQEVIDQFRNILLWIFERSNNHRTVVDEKNTTKECCICGHDETKGPNVREFICAGCDTTLSRDINSAVNIAIKDNLLPGSGHANWDLSQPACIAGWSYQSCKIHLTDFSSMDMSV